MSDWESVKKMSENAFREGKYSNNYGDQTPGSWPVKVENYKGELIGEWTLAKWKEEMAILWAKFQEVLDGRRIPRWEDISYRSEKDFRGGIFSDYVENWVPIINALPTDSEKDLTYKLIFHGLSFTDNQDQIEPNKGRKFRNKDKLCTKIELNPLYESLIEKGMKTFVNKENKWCVSEI